MGYFCRRRDVARAVGGFASSDCTMGGTEVFAEGVVGFFLICEGDSSGVVVWGLAGSASGGEETQQLGRGRLGEHVLGREGLPVWDGSVEQGDVG